MASQYISLRREVRPLSRPGHENTDIRSSPVFCGYCANLHGPTAEQLLPSFNVSLVEQRSTGRPGSTLSKQVQDDSPDPNTWRFSVELADVIRQAADGCSSCLLLKTSVESLTTPEYKNRDLGLTVEFREGYILRGDVYDLLPEDERDVEFELGDAMVVGAVSGKFGDMVYSFELYTLPYTFCPWKTVGSSVPFSELGYSDPNQSDGLARHVVWDSRSEDCLQRIKQWMRECEENHGVCRLSPRFATSTLPRRLIAVGGDDNCGIYLVDTQEQAFHDPVSYTCLSHCWGEVQPLKSEQGSISKWKINIPWEMLPRTFQDAVTVTRYLGFKYLWIDSLAIIQNSEEDWQTEAANMGSIYHSAALVISATGSSNSEGGCFFDRPGFSTIHGTDVHGSNFTVYARTTIPHRAFFGASEGDERLQVSKSAYPLLTRAWVVQEQLLGRFVLHFSKDELVFQCLSGVRCECGTLNDFKMDTLRRIRQFLASTRRNGQRSQADIEKMGNAPLDFWANLILEYSHKSITYPSDRLPALAGMASTWATLGLGKYLAGFWAKGILRDLMWMNLERRSPPKFAPSWSWVSTGLSCDWVTTRDNGRYHVRIDLDRTNCKVKGKGLNPYGEVEMGWLHIAGPVLRTRENGLATEALTLRYYTVVTDGESGFGMDFRLLLERVADSELVGYPDSVRTHENVFKRVGCHWGYSDRDSYDEQAFKDTEMYLI